VGGAQARALRHRRRHPPERRLLPQTHALIFNVQQLSVIENPACSGHPSCFRATADAVFFAAQIDAFDLNCSVANSEKLL